MADPDARPRRLTRAETKARTRAALLDAAATVVARKGFAGASVDEIAATAGFTVGALYSNFANKEQLFLELLAERSSDRLAEATAIMTEPQQGLEGLRAALNALLARVADGDVDLAALQAEFWLYAIRRPEVLDGMAARFRDNRDALSAALAERARERGQAGAVDHDQLATVLIALFQGLVQLRRTDPELVPVDLYGTAAHWIFAGLARPQP